MNNKPYSDNIQLILILLPLSGLTIHPEGRRWGIEYEIEGWNDVRYGDISDLLEILNDMAAYDPNGDIFNDALIFEIKKHDDSSICPTGNNIICYDSHYEEIIYFLNDVREQLLAKNSKEPSLKADTTGEHDIELF